MGLIKAEKVPTSMAAFSMTDIEKAAKSMLLRARHQAEQLLAAAQTEADGLKAAAIAEGRNEGIALGRKEGVEQGVAAGQQQALSDSKARLQEVMTAFSAAANALEWQRADLEASALQEIVKLSAAIARRVTKRQGMLDEAVLLANLEDAMKLVSEAAKVRVAIHPAQRATLADALPRLAMTFPNLAHVEVIDDATLSAGGCRVFSRNGQIDAELETQLDRVIDDLLPKPDDAP